MSNIQASEQTTQRPVEMLNRYVDAVARKLPRNMRQDVASEIRSTLEDMLADRSESSGKPADEAVLAELLRSYGSPAQVAASYLPESFLVGPQIFPLFKLVLTIVFIVLTSLALVGLGVAVATRPMDLVEILKTIGSSLGEYYGGMIAAFGNIVLVFAILERVLPKRNIPDLHPGEEAWDPSDLLKEPDPDEVRQWEPVVAILFNFAALLILNIYPQVLSYTPSLNDLFSGQVVFIPILSEEFFRYLPWLNLLWGLTIVLNLFLLRARRWERGTRVFSIGLKLLGIGILVAMLRGPSLLNLTGEALAAWPAEFEGLKTLAGLLDTFLRIALMIGVVANLVEIAKDIYRLAVRPGAAAARV